MSEKSFQTLERAEDPTASELFQLLGYALATQEKYFGWDLFRSEIAENLQYIVPLHSECITSIETCLDSPTLSQKHVSKLGEIAEAIYLFATTKTEFSKLYHKKMYKSVFMHDMMAMGY